MARCVLPTPGGPSSSRFSPLAIQRPWARSRICLGSTDGCASKSKPARSFTTGKWASFSAMSMRRWSLRAISRSHMSASVSRAERLARPASSSRVSSWSRMPVSLSRVSMASSGSSTTGAAFFARAIRTLLRQSPRTRRAGAAVRAAPAVDAAAGARAERARAGRRRRRHPPGAGRR